MVIVWGYWKRVDRSIMHDGYTDGTFSIGANWTSGTESVDHLDL